MKPRPQFVLWGVHPSYGGIPIKISAGTIQDVRRERKSRQRDPRWTELVIRAASLSHPTQEHAHE